MAFSAPPHSGPTPRRPHLLIVDDDPVVLRALRRLLLGARPSWQIDTADSGEAALELIEHNTYDVVATDLHMPGVDGLTLLGRLKTEQPAVRRVIHSSHVESHRGERLQSLAHALLTKPSRPEEVLRVLDWTVDQRRQRLRDSAGF
jgi:CheY-like chemotaxis protein